MTAFIWYVTQSVNPDQKYANKHRDCKDPVKNYPLCSSCLKQRQVSITSHFFPPFLSLQTLCRFLHIFNYLYNLSIFWFCCFVRREVGLCSLIMLIILTICGHNFHNVFSQQWGDQLLLWTGMLTWRRQEILLLLSTQLDIFNYGGKLTLQFMKKHNWHDQLTDGSQHV